MGNLWLFKTELALCSIYVSTIGHFQKKKMWPKMPCFTLWFRMKVSPENDSSTFVWYSEIRSEIWYGRQMFLALVRVCKRNLCSASRYSLMWKETTALCDSSTVCPESSDPPEKILNILSSENEVYIIFLIITIF